MPLVLFELITPEIGKLVLNDPDQLNAMGDEMAAEFKVVVESLSNNKNLRVIILTGAGRAFSAGGHLEMLKKKSEQGGELNRLLMHKYYNSFLSILDLNIPLIAAINGHAIGAGLCLAAACDIRIASKGAKLGATFTKLGLHPGMAATYSLPRVIGSAKAAELMLTAKVIQAEEGLQIGLVSQVVEPDALMSSAKGIADDILACGPECTRQLLMSIRGNENLSMTQALEREAFAQSVNYGNAEFKEGVNAALEKRAPKWK